MIKALYTPERACHTEMGRRILAWYTRFDVYAGLWSGTGTAIGLEWFHAIDQYFQDMNRAEPMNLEYQIECLFSGLRVQGVEVGQSFAQQSIKEDCQEHLLRQNEQFEQKLRVWREKLQSFLLRGEYIVTLNDEGDEVDSDDPRTSAAVFIRDYWPINYLFLDLLAMEAMQRQQSALILKHKGDPVLSQIALQACQIFEAIERYPDAPKGSILPAQSNMSFICFFVPREEKYLQWCREKLANVECQG